MTATIVAGKYFSPEEQVTSNKLHQIVESAIFSNMGTNELAAGASIIKVSATAPSDTTRPWYDTTIGIYRIYDGSVWTAPNCLVLTNNDAAVVAGDIVILDVTLNNSFKKTTSANSNLVIGVAKESIANAATGLIQTSGKCVVNLKSDTYTSTMVYLGTSTTSGKAQLSATATAGQCGRWLIQPATNATSATVLLWGHPAL